MSTATDLQAPSFEDFFWKSAAGKLMREEHDQKVRDRRRKLAQDLIQLKIKEDAETARLNAEVEKAREAYEEINQKWIAALRNLRAAQTQRNHVAAQIYGQREQLNREFAAVADPAIMDAVNFVEGQWWGHFAQYHVNARQEVKQAAMEAKSEAVRLLKGLDTFEGDLGPELKRIFRELDEKVRKLAGS